MTEAICDARVAPKLAKIAEICRDHKMSMVALVEYEPGERGRTELIASPGMEMHIAIMAARCGGNVDALIIGLMKYGREHGHSSAFLKQLGVPLQPETTSTL